MKNKIIVTISLIGILAGTATAYFFNLKRPPLPPVFEPASNPYARGDLRRGHHRKRSDQRRKHQRLSRSRRDGEADFRRRRTRSAQGRAAAIDRRFDPAGHHRATKISRLGRPRHARRTESGTQEGKHQHSGSPSHRRASVTENHSGRTKKAKCGLSNSTRDPISKDALDSAVNAEAVAEANLEVARRQRDLTKAGAWIFDIQQSGKTDGRSREVFCGIQRAARKVHSEGSRRRSGALHQFHGGELRLRAGRI